MPRAKATSKKATSVEAELAEFVSQFYYDPVGYAKACFPWGQGAIANSEGLQEWQIEVLQHVGEQVRQRDFDGQTAVKPIRVAISSGHGVGKSTLTGILSSWILDTRPYSQGSCSANTGLQLSTKTWAAISTWKSRAITAHWWEIGAEQIRNLKFPKEWFLSALTSNADKSEAFAGQHAANSTSFYIFDEASAISDKIFEVAEGGLTDGEPMIFLMGNPTKNSGTFYNACFSGESRYKAYCIDSRNARYTNKETIAEWLHDYGEDSDFFRVRVRGLPPRASDTQFIPMDLVKDAMLRTTTVLSGEPLVVGVDISRGGHADTVIRFRQGYDAYSHPAIRISGEDSRDSTRTIAILAEILKRPHAGKMISAMFLDSTGVGAPYYDRLRQLGHYNVHPVQFGSKSPERQCANMRSFIWFKCREWLKFGCIGKDLPLEAQLTAPGFHYDKDSRIVMESKEDMRKRGIDSPDDADALCCTFAFDVGMGRTQDPQKKMLTGVLGMMKAGGNLYG